MLSTDERHLVVTAPRHDNRYRRLPLDSSASRLEWDGSGRLGMLEQNRVTVYDPGRSKIVDRSSPADARGTQWLDLAFSPDGRRLTTIAGVRGHVPPRPLASRAPDPGVADDGRSAPGPGNCTASPSCPPGCWRWPRTGESGW
ncbi:hypothetical protein SGLAM104S_02878 [Streptomyces glaucescens]